MEMSIRDNIVFIRQTFHDLEKLKGAAEKWNLNFRQLDSGKLEGEMMILDTEQVQLGTVSFNRKFEQKGTTPEGYRTFAIPADSKQFFKWREYEITGNFLMLFPKSGEIDAVNYPGFKVFTFSLSDGLMQSLLGLNENQFPELIPENPQVLELSTNSMNILRQSVSYLFEKVEKNSEIINKAAFKRLMIKNVPSILLSSFQTPIQTSPITKMRIRDISFKKAVSYLESCSSDFPTVFELCLIAGASQRTLEYAFKEKYGISPRNYIKKLQLNRARAILRLSDPRTNTVNEIARKLGFNHLGQFAADYKKLFGELPTKTLRRD